jgi:hemoglobin
MERPSLYEHAGGRPAFLRVAAAHHQRCLDDPVLNHPFSHPGDPNLIEHLARYWAEALGGPAEYSGSCGGHSAMLELHARTQAKEDLGRRFIDCFVKAADDAGLPDLPQEHPEWGRGPRRVESPGRRCTCESGTDGASREGLNG